MGAVNQLGKFSPNVAELSAPLRKLLSTKNAWLWGPEQETSFRHLISELTTPTILTFYNPSAPTKISADASSYGPGAVLLQASNSTWHPVAYASRAMTATESHYTQIEKEALALTWACDKFSCYILGKHVVLETDHKPLVPILSYKHLDNLPPRVLRFRLRLMRFDYDVVHVPGKYLYTADMLSRSPRSGVLYTSSETRLNTYRQGQADDAIVSKVITYCQSGWPHKHQISDELRPYWAIRGKLSLYDHLLLYGNRIVVPPKLRSETLAKIHQGHQGIQRCHLRIMSSIWWPGVSQAVETYVKHCSHCQKRYVPPREPLISSTLPSRPWNRVAADLFEFNNTHYLAVVDYFSRYPEVCQLQSTTSASIIKALKSIFARHGIPSVLFSDNGPQFNSTAFKEFSSLYHFQHTTSSPRYPQSNGLVERTVKTVKALLTDTSNPHLALLSYRATPLPWCNISPAELLFGRKIATDLP